MTTKKTTLMAMLPILAAVLVMAPTVEQSYAQALKPTHPDVTKLSPSSFGAKTADRVCGDKLCSEVRESLIDIEEEDIIEQVSKELEHMPDLDLIKIIKYRDNSAINPVSHTIIYKVTGGTERLTDIAIEVTSDIDEVEYNITSLLEHKSTVNVVRVKALDADSINIQVVGYTIAS